MDTDSGAGDVDCQGGGLSLLESRVDRILMDTVSQQQGWLRVYGEARARALSAERSLWLCRGQRSLVRATPVERSEVIGHSSTSSLVRRLQVVLVCGICTFIVRIDIYIYCVVIFPCVICRV